MKKNIYVAPVVELLEARVEKGFAGSGSSQDIPNVGLSVYYNQAGTGNGTGNPSLLLVIFYQPSIIPPRVILRML